MLDKEMSEDEAMKRWCPFVRVARYDIKEGTDHYPGVVTNRGFIISEEALEVDSSTTSEVRCIGRECMAWHTTEQPKDINEPERGYCRLIP